MHRCGLRLQERWTWWFPNFVMLVTAWKVVVGLSSVAWLFYAVPVIMNQRIEQHSIFWCIYKMSQKLFPTHFGFTINKKIFNYFCLESRCTWLYGYGTPGTCHPTLSERENRFMAVNISTSLITPIRSLGQRQPESGKCEETWVGIKGSYFQPSVDELNTIIRVSS